MAYPQLSFHREAWRFVVIFAVITSLLFMISDTLGWIGIILTSWCAYFFRDPNRVVPTRPGLIVSPADGIVVKVASVVPPKEFDMGKEPRVRVSIFLNVFDVHVNRIPLGGIIRKTIYHPGKFVNASLDKASDDNERQSVIIDLEKGQNIAVVQIAGLIARRIICDIREDDVVLTGGRYGMIRFGSRADVYLPEGIQSLVAEGQRMVGGETVLADLESTESSRQGSVR